METEKMEITAAVVATAPALKEAASIERDVCPRDVEQIPPYTKEIFRKKRFF